MKKIHLFTIGTLCLLSSYSCNPVKDLNDSIGNMSYTPQEQHLGYIEANGKRWNIEYSNRTVWNGLELAAQTESPDSNASGVNSVRFYIGGGAVTNSSYSIIADDDDLNLTDKQIAVNYYDLLTTSDYNSINNEPVKAEITLSESGKMTISISAIKLVKNWGKGNDTITFSCTVVEKED